MAFGFAGAAAGAAKSLEDIVAERILAQKLEAEIADRQQRAALDQQQLDQRAKEFGVESGQRQQQIDMQAADRRSRDNDKGVRRMISESLMQGGTPDRKALAAMQIEAGDAPTMLNEPTPERDPIADYEAKKKLDRQYDRPPVLKPERDPIADYEARKAIDAKYATNGNGPNPQKAAETRSKILEAAKGLKADPGLGNLVGNRVLNPDYNLGISSEPRAGTSAANAQAKFNTLKSLLTLENLGLLKGAMSDKDLAFIQSAGSSLDTKMDDPVFVAELDKIIQKFENVSDTPPPAGGPSGVAFIWDGTKLVKPGGR